MGIKDEIERIQEAKKACVIPLSYKKNLDEVIVGDKVVLNDFSRKKIATVQDITPKGFIKVNNMLFYKNGNRRSGGKYSSYSIEVLTPELYDEIEKERIINTALALMWNVKKHQISIKFAYEIISIFREYNMYEEINKHG